MIKINKLNKYYNKRATNEIHVINDVSLELPDKGIIALFGQSGSGKTTLLNAIGGLDRVDSGSIDIDGHTFEKYNSVEWDALRNREIGYIFQSYNLVEDMSVYDNLDLALKLAGVADQKKREERILHTLDAVGILKYKKRRPTSLSGGQQQRVVIARAICKHPKIIIADEPTGNLDDRNTIAVMDIIKQISKYCLVVLVTHEPKLVEYYADEEIEVVDGKIANRRVISSSGNLDVVYAATIYLKDLNKSEAKADNAEVAVYSDVENADNVKITLIRKNDKYYIKLDNDAGRKVQYVDRDSEVVLKDEHYVPRDKSEEVSLIDLNIIKPVETGAKEAPIISAKQALKDGFAKLFSSTTRAKRRKRQVGLAIFVMTAILICTAFGMLAKVLLLEPEEYIKYDDNYYVIILNRKNSSYEDVKKIAATDGVRTVVPDNILMKTVYIEAPSFMQANNRKLALANSFAYAPIEKFDGELIYGRKPVKEGEVIIDEMSFDVRKYLGNENLDSYGYQSVKDLLGKEISFIGTTKTVEIVGIANTGSLSMWMYEKDFYTFVNSNIGNASIGGGGAYYGAYDIAPSPSSGAEAEIDVDAVKKAVWDSKFSTYDQNNVYVYFYADSDAVLSSFADYKVKEVRPFEKQQAQESKLNEMVGMLTFSLVMLAVSMIAMFFMQRSSTFSRIREIGVLRSIGASKRNIYKIFFYELVAVIICSTMVGYFIGVYLTAELAKSAIGLTMFKFNFFIAIVALAVTVGFNILFGMLPVIGLLRKTPAEILSKYDI